MTMTMHDTSSQLLMEQSCSRLCLNLDHDHVTRRAEGKALQQVERRKDFRKIAVGGTNTPASWHWR